MAVSSDTGARLFTMGGPVTSATPGVRHTATDNLACLIAITRALTWAADDPVANPILPIGEHSRPICIRYDMNEYAAMIATGVWKAKKHKDAAPLAQRAWKRLKARKGERLPAMDSACMQGAPARRVLGEGSAGTRTRRQAWDVHLRGGRQLEPLGAFGAELPRAPPGARPTPLRAGGAPPRRHSAPARPSREG